MDKLSVNDGVAPVGLMYAELMEAHLRAELDRALALTERALWFAVVCGLSSAVFFALWWFA
jgi:hypothetical protein